MNKHTDVIVYKFQWSAAITGFLLAEILYLAVVFVSDWSRRDAYADEYMAEVMAEMRQPHIFNGCDDTTFKTVWPIRTGTYQYDIVSYTPDQESRQAGICK